MSTTATEALIARWIEPDPHKPGPATAWVLPRCVSVWSVIRQLELDGAPETVADDYDLPVEAVHAAVAYYQQHKDEIDARIRRNRKFFGV